MQVKTFSFTKVNIGNNVATFLQYLYHRFIWTIGLVSFTTISHYCRSNEKNSLKSPIFPCPKCYPNISSTKASKIRNILMQHQTYTYSLRGLVVRAIVSEIDVLGSILDGGMDRF